MIDETAGGGDGQGLDAADTEVWAVEEAQSTYGIRSFRDLLVWQKSMRLVRMVYDETRPFPRVEQYGLTGQMRRAAVSIPSNIAEGYGRRSSGDYSRFLNVARGSVFELMTQIEISIDLGYIEHDGSPHPLIELAAAIERMLASLIRKIDERCHAGPSSL